jgi:hypothetical protein
MHNMLIRPSLEELEDYGEPDFIIYNAGGHVLMKVCPGGVFQGYFQGRGCDSYHDAGGA